MLRLGFLIAVAVACCSNSSLSFAQSGFGGSSGGSMGGGGMSSGGMGGSSGFGGSSGGMGGTSGFGGSSGGMGGTSGFGSTTGFGQGGTSGAMGGQQQQQGQFLGRNTNTNTFLGRTTQGGAQGANGMNGQTQNTNRRGNTNRNANQANMNQQQQGGSASGRAQSQFPPVRPRQKVAFEYSKPQMQTVSVGLETRMIKKPIFKGVSVSVSPSGELIMTGAVASAGDAKLAESMARLEPGVYSIRNELTYPEPIEE